MIALDYILKIENLSVSEVIEEKTIIVLDNLSFKIKENQLFSLIGVTNSGKSFLFLFLFRLTKSYKFYDVKGEALFYSKILGLVDLLTCSDKEINLILKYHISFIPQNPTNALNPTFTVRKQLIKQLKYSLNISYHKAASEYDKLFDKLDIGEKETFKYFPKYLLASQIQKIILALCKILPHSLIIIDQPVFGLNSIEQKLVLDIIESLKETGKTIIYINNNLSFLPLETDRILMFEKGSIVEQNTIINIFTNAKTYYTQAFIACRPRTDIYIKYIPLLKDIKLYHTQNKNINPVGDILLHNYLPQDQVIDSCRELNQLPILLEAKNINILRTNQYILKNLTFKLHEKEVLGVIGDEESGKDYIIEAIFEENKALIRNGKLLFEGKELGYLLKNKNIQLVKYNSYHTLHPDMTIREILTETIEDIKINLNSNELEQELYSLLSLTPLSYIDLEKYPNQLSKYQRLYVVLLRVLSIKPKIIIFYQPSFYLDSLKRAEFLNLLKYIHKKMAISYIYISDNLADLHFLTQRIIVLDKGEMVELSNTPDIFKHSSKLITQKFIRSFPCILPQNIRNKHIITMKHD